MLTRNGIAYDFKESPYKITLNYNDIEIIYKFSSQLYVDKFKNRLEDNRTIINEGITRKYNINFSNDILCDLHLYSEIEKRGFLIFIDGRVCTCLSSIRLDGLSKIVSN